MIGGCCTLITFIVPELIYFGHVDAEAEIFSDLLICPKNRLMESGLGEPPEQSLLS
jgi:hypothetical protein